MKNVVIACYHFSLPGCHFSLFHLEGEVISSYFLGLAWPLLYYPDRNSKGADQTAQMCRLFCTFVVCIWHKQGFPWRGSNMNTTSGSYGLQVIHLTASVEAEVNVDGCRNRCRNWGNVGLLYRAMLRQMQQKKQQIYYMYMYMSKFSLLYIDRFFLFLFGFYGPSKLFHSFWAESIIRWGENGRSQRKTTWPPASRTWLVSRDPS